VGRRSPRSSRRLSLSSWFGWALWAREGDFLFAQKYLSRRFSSPLGMEELRRIPIVNTAAFLKAGPSMLLTSLASDQAEILLDLLFQRNPSEFPASLLPESKRDIALPPMVEILALTVREGGKKIFIRYVRERKPSLVRANREAVLAATGRLACEVCGFDFRQCYGHLGEGFCEVHHTEPLSTLKAETEVKITDFAIICSNCHRMIHRDGVKTVSALREMLPKV